MRKIKAVLFDVDGVLIRVPHYFGTELEGRGYKDAAEWLRKYFHDGDHYPCLEGKGDLKERIEPYLRGFGWEHSVDEYFRQQLEFEGSFLDGEMMGIVAELRGRGMKCLLATDQEEHRLRFLLEEMDFRNLFDGCFVSCRIGCRKIDDGFWAHVARELADEGIEPAEAAFFDDLQDNVDVALRAGIQAELFGGGKQSQEDFGALIERFKA